MVKWSGWDFHVTNEKLDIVALDLKMTSMRPPTSIRKNGFNAQSFFLLLVISLFVTSSVVDGYSSFIQPSATRWGIRSPTSAPTTAPTSTPNNEEPRKSKRTKKHKKVEEIDVDSEEDENKSEKTYKKVDNPVTSANVEAESRKKSKKRSKKSSKLRKKLMDDTIQDEPNEHIGLKKKSKRKQKKSAKHGVTFVVQDTNTNKKSMDVVNQQPAVTSDSFKSKKKSSKKKSKKLAKEKSRLSTSQSESTVPLDKEESSLNTKEESILGAGKDTRKSKRSKKGTKKSLNFTAESIEAIAKEQVGTVSSNIETSNDSPNAEDEISSSLGKETKKQKKRAKKKHESPKKRSEEDPDVMDEKIEKSSKKKRTKKTKSSPEIGSDTTKHRVESSNTIPLHIPSSKITNGISDENTTVMKDNGVAMANIFPQELIGQENGGNDTLMESEEEKLVDSEDDFQHESPKNVSRVVYSNEHVEKDNNNESTAEVEVDDDDEEDGGGTGLGSFKEEGNELIDSDFSLAAENDKEEYLPTTAQRETEREENAEDEPQTTDDLNINERDTDETENEQEISPLEGVLVANEVASDSESEESSEHDEGRGDIDQEEESEAQILLQSQNRFKANENNADHDQAVEFKQQISEPTSTNATSQSTEESRDVPMETAEPVESDTDDTPEEDSIDVAVTLRPRVGTEMDSLESNHLENSSELSDTVCDDMGEYEPSLLEVRSEIGSQITKEKINTTETGTIKADDDLTVENAESLASSDMSDTDEVDMDEYEPTLLENAGIIESSPKVASGSLFKGISEAEKIGQSNGNNQKEQEAENDPYLEPDVVEFIGNVLQEDVRPWLNETTEDDSSGGDNGERVQTEVLKNKSATIEGSRGGYQEIIEKSSPETNQTVLEDRSNDGNGDTEDEDESEDKGSDDEVSEAERGENENVDKVSGETNDDGIADSNKNCKSLETTALSKNGNESGAEVNVGQSKNETKDDTDPIIYRDAVETELVVPNQGDHRAGADTEAPIRDRSTGASFKKSSTFLKDNLNEKIPHKTESSDDAPGEEAIFFGKEVQMECPSSVSTWDRKMLESSEDKDTDAIFSVVSWNLAEESPSEDDASFIRKFRKNGLSSGTGSDLVLIAGQECENIKPRRTEGRRSREYRRLMVKMLGKQYVPIALHLLGGIQFGLFAKRSFMSEIEEVSVADVTCGIGNVFHNKGAIAAFVKLKARNSQNSSKGAESRSKSLRMVFVSAHMAAHVKNADARDSDFWRISAELEAQAPPGFLPRRPSSDSGSTEDGSFLFDSVDRVFFCGDLNYRLDLPRESTEHDILNCEQVNDHAVISSLLSHDQLTKTIAQRTAFPGFAEGKIAFAPTFKFDKETGDYDTSHKQRIPAWTDRVLFKPHGTRVLEYTSVPNARHSDHRPVHATFRVDMEGDLVTSKSKRKSKKGAGSPRDL